MRINKFLSESGMCSRRGADELISAGRVTINGQVAGPGSQALPTDLVLVDGEKVGASRKLSKPVYIALNKPVGITCTTEQSVKGNIVDFVDHPERVFPIGRLDKDSEGLILLTNNGDIVNQVLRVENAHEKEYLVAVDRTVTDDFVRQMARGVRLRHEHTRPCKIWKVGSRVFRIVLTQGLNRQIRRMCEVFDYKVIALQRVRIMHIELGSLKVGRWRNLTPGEVQGLLQDKPAQSGKPGQASRTAQSSKPGQSSKPAQRGKH